MNRSAILFAPILAAAWFLAPATASLAQTGDAAFQTNQLEEQIRLLNGRIEDMNFQILQMQEQLRKMQEDNEFRFQELEQRRGALGSTDKNQTAKGEQPGKLQPLEQNGGAQPSSGDEVVRVPQSGDATASAGVETLAPNENSGDVAGLNPQVLGTMTFDQNGNLVDTTTEKPIDLTGGRNQPVKPADPGSGDGIAALALPQNPDELYDLGYGYIQSGDYALAQEAFEDFAQKNPAHAKISEARFWIGESLFARGQYEEAARVFLDAHKQYPAGRLGAQTLVKLGSSLAGMNQRELACSTYAEAPRKYPNMSNALRTKIVAEQKAANCKPG